MESSIVGTQYSKLISHFEHSFPSQLNNNLFTEKCQQVTLNPAARVSEMFQVHGKYLSHFSVFKLVVVF